MIATLPPPPPGHIEIRHLDQHPRLWISADGVANTPTVALLRARLKAPGSAAAWSSIQSARGIEFRALVYLLTADASALE